MFYLLCFCCLVIGVLFGINFKDDIVNILRYNDNKIDKLCKEKFLKSGLASAVILYNKLYREKKINKNLRESKKYIENLCQRKG